MKLLLHLGLDALVIYVAGYLLEGVNFSSYWVAVVTAIVLGVLNFLIKPILIILTLPINILTLGLFSIVINTAMVLLAAWLVPGFEVLGFLWALAFSVVVSIISAVLNMMAK